MPQLQTSVQPCRAARQHNAARGHRAARRRPPVARQRGRLYIEVLEDRCVPSYTITDLGNPDGFSIAYAINSAGQVAGEATTAGRVLHAVVWDSDGTRTDLDWPSGISAAYGINSAGQVAGYVVEHMTYVYAVVWDSDGSITDLPAPLLYSVAFGLNDSGQAVGVADILFEGDTHATFWDTDHTLRILSGAPSRAMAINDRSQVVGQVSNHAVVWESDGTMSDLGDASVAFGLNDSGQVVGLAYTASGESHAAFWDTDHTLTDLGDYSVARGINSAGQVVGESRTADGGMIHAVFWDSDHTLTDLNTQIPPDSGWVLSYAQAINDSGQIVGYGRINGNPTQRAFLLTPARSPGSGATRPIPVRPHASPSAQPESGVANGLTAVPLFTVSFLPSDPVATLPPRPRAGLARAFTAPAPDGVWLSGAEHRAIAGRAPALAPAAVDLAFTDFGPDWLKWDPR